MFWLNSLNGFRFLFWWRDSENRQYEQSDFSFFFIIYWKRYHSHLFTRLKIIHHIYSKVKLIWFRDSTAELDYPSDSLPWKHDCLKTNKWAIKASLINIIFVLRTIHFGDQLSMSSLSTISRPHSQRYTIKIGGEVFRSESQAKITSQGYVHLPAFFEISVLSENAKLNDVLRSFPNLLTLFYPLSVSPLCKHMKIKIMTLSLNRIGVWIESRLKYSLYFFSARSFGIQTSRFICPSTSVERNADCFAVSNSIPRFVHFNAQSDFYLTLLYRQACFTGKYTTRKTRTKLHPGLEWRIFHILTSEYIDDVISSFSWLFVQTVGEKW